MAALVVQTHPVSTSFGAAVGAAAVRGLRDSGETTRLARVCQGDTVTADSFRGVNHLVIAHPTWWGSVPAELLTLLRDLVGAEPGVARPHAPAGPGPLSNVSSLTVIATHGGSWFINRLQGEPGKRLWQRHILKHCAPGAAFRWMPLYRVDQISHERRAAFLDQVTRAVATGATRPGI